MMLKFLLAQAKRFPWITNITWYSSIFTAGDLAQQKLHNKEKVDLKQTRNVAILAFSFHGNIFYLWLRLMERMFPGTAPGNVLRKVVCDQLVITPTGVSGFYIEEILLLQMQVCMSVMEGKHDIFAVWREKFWDTYKVAIIYWPTVQLINYGLIPVFFRMAFFGSWGFVWVIFMSHLRQHRHSSENLIKNYGTK